MQQPRVTLDRVLAHDETGSFIEARLQCWTPDDCPRTFPGEWNGQVYEASRSWVIYHVMDNELHHGG